MFRKHRVVELPARYIALERTKINSSSSRKNTVENNPAILLSLFLLLKGRKGGRGSARYIKILRTPVGATFYFFVSVCFSWKEDGGYELHHTTVL